MILQQTCSDFHIQLVHGCWSGFMADWLLGVWLLGGPLLPAASSTTPLLSVSPAWSSGCSLRDSSPDSVQVLSKLRNCVRCCRHSCCFRDVQCDASSPGLSLTMWLLEVLLTHKILSICSLTSASSFVTLGFFFNATHWVKKCTLHCGPRGIVGDLHGATQTQRAR